MFVNSKHSLSNHAGRLLAEKTNHLYSNQKLGHIGTLVNASILAAVLWNLINHFIICAWILLIVAITAARYCLVWQYNRRNRQSAPIRFWRNLFLFGIVASGTAWGLAGIFLFPQTSCAHQMFVAFTIGGMVAGASAAYAAFRRAFFAFSLPAVLPITIYFLMLHDSIHVGMAAMLTLFLVLMSATSFRNNRVIDTSVKLRFEKQGLLEYLEEARDRAEETNHRLQAEIVQRRRIEDELENHQKQLQSEVDKRSRELCSRNRDLQIEIMERSRVEASLRDSEERYRLLIENAISGIILIRDQKIIFANTVVSTFSGYSAEEIIGASFIDFIHPDDRELAISNHAKRLSGERFAETYAIRMLNRQKEVRWLEVSAARLTYEGLPAILVFIRDITKQHNLEIQLVQNEKMASIGQLAAGVAHEINNPLGFVNSNLHTLDGYQKDIRQVIAGYKEVLSDIKPFLAGASHDGLLDKISAVEDIEADIDVDYIIQDNPQLIRESLEGVERIKKIVLDLKDFAHPGEQGRQLIDINKSIESTLNIVWNELKYSADVIKDFGRLPEIECYPQQLNQVFMNVLVNAAQALEEKGEIRIKTRELDGNVEIEISDTGCGIPSENLERIFDPFFTTKPVGKGTGLGLNVSYNIIQKHNGSITATSKAGQGTAFTIRLPI